MESTFEVDKIIGMSRFITDTPGIGGRLRDRISDFRVDEVFEDAPEDPDGEYTHAVMEKFNWETLRAIKQVARSLRVSGKRIGFAGNKDKRALTTQRIAVWKVEPAQLEKVRIRDIKLSDFRKTNERVNLGNALGNRFTILCRNVSDDTGDILPGLMEEVRARGVPNYFGYQRFGVIRPNTHLVGKKLFFGDLEGAVMQYLGSPYDMERDDVREARGLLDESMDFKKALEVFPRRLNFERTMIAHLAQKPADYAGALRKLPKKLRWMLANAYQSYLFNLVLSRMMEEGIEIRGAEIPLFGYLSEFTEGRQGEIEREVLEAEEVVQENFKVPSLPEISAEGAYRKAWIDTEIDYELTEKGAVFKFFLPPGSYATVILREFMKGDPLNY